MPLMRGLSLGVINRPSAADAHDAGLAGLARTKAADAHDARTEI